MEKMTAEQAKDKITEILEGLENNQEFDALMIQATLHSLLGSLCAHPGIASAWFETVAQFNRNAIAFYEDLN